MGRQVLAGHAEHATGAGGGVVDGPDHPGLGERLVVLDEEQVDHEPDNLARGEVLAGRLVGQLSELADELLKNGAHLGVADGVRVQVDVGELLGHQVEQPGLGQPVNLGVEIEAGEDVAHGWREGLDVGAQILADVVLVAHELFQVQGRGIVKELAGLFEEEWLGIELGLGALGQLRQHAPFGRLQDAIQAPQHGEGQDDLAVVGLLVVATQQVGYGPDKGREIRIGHGCQGSSKEAPGAATALGQCVQPQSPRGYRS